MIMPICRLNNHVIDIYFKISPNLVGEDCVHETLACGTNIFYAEGQNIVVVVVMVR